MNVGYLSIYYLIITLYNQKNTELVCCKHETNIVSQFYFN